MVRTATLDLNSRGSFVDDLNSRPGIVMCRVALLQRSHEIQPASSDSEKRFFLFSLFFLLDWDLLVSGFVRFYLFLCAETWDLLVSGRAAVEKF